MNELQATLFDYAELDASMCTRLQARAERISAREEQIAENILANGKEFIEARDELRHNKSGGFRGWIAHHGWSKTRVYRYISVYERFGNCPNLGQLDPSALYVLAEEETPESARAEAIERAESGETISYSEARDIVQEHKTEQEQLQRQYDGMPMIVPPDYEDEPLTPYERTVEELYTKHQTPAVEYIPAPAMSQPMSVLTSQGTIEWYTPPAIIDMARLVLGGIDLDPASSDTAQGWIQAAAHYTAERPIDRAWTGRVWLNPPFDDTPAWVDRLDSEYQDGAVTAAVLLVNSAPGYIWWEDLWRRRPVCMIRERLCFYKADGTPGGQAKKGTTIAYYGQDVAAFKKVFGAIGRIILPND